MRRLFVIPCPAARCFGKGRLGVRESLERLSKDTRQHADTMFMVP